LIKASALASEKLFILFARRRVRVVELGLYPATGRALFFGVI